MQNSKSHVETYFEDLIEKYGGKYEYTPGTHTGLVSPSSRLYSHFVVITAKIKEQDYNLNIHWSLGNSNLATYTLVYNKPSSFLNFEVNVHDPFTRIFTKKESHFKFIPEDKQTIKTINEKLEASGMKDLIYDTRLIPIISGENLKTYYKLRVVHHLEIFNKQEALIKVVDFLSLMVKTL